MLVKRKHDPFAGAKAALLDEYQRALNELQRVIATVAPAELTAIIDPQTEDPNGRSIQAVLAHVVRSAFSYATYIRLQHGEQLDFRPIRRCETIAEYQAELTAAFAFTRETFENHPEIELEVFISEHKMMVSWGQLYDTEQLMEHAIVHLLRHRRQIERFLSALRAR